jgi:sialic acid synthase SpsE
VGLSDHGTDPTAVIMAVTLGAVLYEKHFMLPGQAAIDAAVSADPEQFAALVQAAARTHAALGDGRKRCLPAESPNVVPSRRSVYATRDLRAGDVITADAIAVLRPAAGLEPRFAPDLIGRHALRDVAAGSPFRLDDLAGSPERSTTHVA